MMPRPSDATAARYAENPIGNSRPVRSPASRPPPLMADTTDATERTDDRVDPDVIVWGRDDEATSPRTGDRARPPSWQRRLRRFAEPALLVAGISAAIMVMHIADDPSAPERAGSPSTGPAAAARAPQVQLRLIAPAIAAPGERVVVLAFKNAGLCGQAELRFDGTSVPHRLTGIAGSRLPDRVEMFLGMQVPRSATAGMHTLDLYGPAANSSTSAVCAHRGERSARLATTTIVVAGLAPGPHGVSPARGDHPLPKSDYHADLPFIGPGYAPSNLNTPARQQKP
jgi:hypothetical protein